MAWLFTACYWSIAVLVVLLSFKQIPPHFIHKSIRLWGNLVLKILGIQIELLNPSTLETKQPRVIVCNHQSALDLIWGAFICPPAPLAIGKKEIIYVPFVNLAWWAFNFIRIDRKNLKNALHSLAGVSQEIVKNQRSLFIAPEGTRTHDGSILPFKKGAFHIAISCQAPIYPVVISGAFELMPKGSFFAKQGTIRISFLPPISTLGKTSKDIDFLIEKVRTQMIEKFNFQQNITDG